jgi:hypothetical protein
MQFDFLYRHPACHCGSAEGQTQVLLQVLFKWRLLMMGNYFLIPNFLKLFNKLAEVHGNRTHPGRY